MSNVHTARAGDSQPTHTPGPWEYGPAENYHGFWIAPKGRLPTLASVERCGQQVNVMAHNFPGSTEANARLIASAPALYAALSDLLRQVDENVAEFGEADFYTGSALAALGRSNAPEHASTLQALLTDETKSLGK